MRGYLRRNIKTSIVHEKSVTLRMKTADKKFCSQCLAKRANIFIRMNSEGSNKLRNKKSEFIGACSCKARFIRLYLKGVGGADKAPCGCQNCLVKLAQQGENYYKKEIRQAK